MKYFYSLLNLKLELGTCCKCKTNWVSFVLICINICIALIGISYASHVDALDVQRMDVKHAKLEPNHKTVFGGHIQTMGGSARATEDPAQCRKGPRP